MVKWITHIVPQINPLYQTAAVNLERCMMGLNASACPKRDAGMNVSWIHFVNSLKFCGPSYCGLLGNVAIKHHVFVYPAEITEQICVSLTLTRRLPLWCHSVLFMLTVVMETDYTLWIMDHAKPTQAVWTGPNSGPAYLSRARCGSPAVQTPVTSGRPAQVQIWSRILM